MIINSRSSLLFVIGKIKMELLFTLGIGMFTSLLTHKFYSDIPVIPIAIPAFLGTAIL